MRVGQGGNLGWLRDREMGLQPPLGHNDQFKTMLYSSVDVHGFWDPVNRSTEGSYGGIFNFDFSTDGYDLHSSVFNFYTSTSPSCRSKVRCDICQPLSVDPKLEKKKMDLYLVILAGNSGVFK